MIIKIPRYYPFLLINQYWLLSKNLRAIFGNDFQIKITPDVCVAYDETFDKRRHILFIEGKGTDKQDIERIGCQSRITF